MRRGASHAWLMAAPLVVWFLYFVVAWAFVEMGCPLVARGVWPLEQDTMRTLLLVASAVTLGVIAALGWSGWRLHARAQREDSRAIEPRGASSPPSRLDPRFAGLLTFLVAILATVASVWTALPLLMVPPCS